MVEALPGALLDLRWDDGQPLRISFDERREGTVVAVRVTDFAGADPPAAPDPGFVINQVCSPNHNDTR